MTTELFFNTIEGQLKVKQPFVVYRKPNEAGIKALLQKNSELHKTDDFTESGFVFAPFDTEESAIVIPENASERIEIDSPLFEIDNQKNKSVVFSDDNLNTLTEKNQHIKLVENGIKAINNHGLKKVVLSRKEQVPLTISNPVAIFKELVATYSAAFVYCWYHPKVGMWLGATPETLLTLENSVLKTMSLAGTQAYTGISHVVWQEKEREEQQIVTDFIISNLQSFVSNLKISAVETIKAGNVLHLKSAISAKLNASNSNLKSVIEALHPTPAVCGMPRKNAKQFIIQNEYYKREFYTGFLGELNMKKSVKRNTNRRNIENNAYNAIKKTSRLFVNLRCMKIQDSQAHIFVGGGITNSSNAIKEWEETVAKSITMKKVLQ